MVEGWNESATGGSRRVEEEEGEEEESETHIASGPTAGRVLLRPQEQVEDREPSKVDIQIDAQSGDIAHTPEVDPVLLRPPAFERGGSSSELVRLGLDGRGVGVSRSEAGEGETESQEFGESSHCKCCCCVSVVLVVL